MATQVIKLTDKALKEVEDWRVFLNGVPDAEFGGVDVTKVEGEVEIVAGYVKKGDEIERISSSMRQTIERMAAKPQFQEKAA